MYIEIRKPGVTDGSSVLDVGTIIEYPNAVAQTLIKGGYATEIATKDNDELTPEIATKKLGKLKVDELIGFAVDYGVEIADGANKADIIAAIVDADVYADILG